MRLLGRVRLILKYCGRYTTLVLKSISSLGTRLLFLGEREQAYGLVVWMGIRSVPAQNEKH